MNILRAILSEPWAVSSEFFHAMQPVIDGLIKGNSQDLAQFSNQYKAEILNRNGYSIGLLPIQGAITRADYCGDMGTESMSVHLEQWAEDSSISGVILNINSPGGMVSFTENLATQIRNYPKPIISYVSGVGASAAYWIGSGASKLYLSAETDMVGSIGTMISFQKRVKDGQYAVYDYVSVYADESYDKNAAFDDMLKGKYDRVKNELLNPLNSVFLNAVKTYRSDVNDEALHGKMYLATQAVQMGLADGIRSIDQVIDEVISMSQNQPNMSIFSKFLGGLNQKSNSTMKKNETLSAILGRDVMENEALSAEDNAKITAHIAGVSTPPAEQAPTANIGELVANAVNSALAPVTEQIGSINQNLETISGRVSKLEDKPAATSTTVAPVAEADDNVPSFKKADSAMNQLAKSQLGL